MCNLTVSEMTFDALGLPEELRAAVADLGFTAPTPVQAQAIPLLMNGSGDIVALAQTGTGKTAAFGLPLLAALDPQDRAVQALVICPTRELCLQITEDFKSFTTHLKGIYTTAVYGGAAISTQIRELKKGTHVIVATPGRLMDLMERRVIDLSQVKVAVLDEADEMLNMGFREDIEYILGHTPDSKRTWLFSATMPADVRHIASKFMNKPDEVTVGRTNQGAENIEHFYYVTPVQQRFEVLKRIVDDNPGLYCIVFARTKLECQDIAEKMIREGYNADALHGDLSQAQRDKVMARYRDRSLQLLIATDVAARGIDVSNITHVINYSLPDEPEVYTHRSGRTARAGKSGVSIAIIHTREMRKLQNIERILGRRFIKQEIPNPDHVVEKQFFHFIDKLVEVDASDERYTTYLPAVLEKLEHLSKDEVVRRMVALELSRFLDYYKNASNLSGGAAPSRRDSDGPEAGYKTMVINIGSRDGVNKGSLLRFVLDTSEMPKGAIGRMRVMDLRSFIDVEDSVVDQFLRDFKSVKDGDREISAKLDDGPPAGARGPRGPREGGGRDGGRGGYGGDKPRRGGYGDRPDRGGERGDRGDRSGSGERTSRYAGGASSGGGSYNKDRGSSAPRGGRGSRDRA